MSIKAQNAWLAVEKEVQYFERQCELLTASLSSFMSARMSLTYRWLIGKPRPIFIYARLLILGYWILVAQVDWFLVKLKLTFLTACPLRKESLIKW